MYFFTFNYTFDFFSCLAFCRREPKSTGTLFQGVPLLSGTDLTQINKYMS